MGKPKEFEMPKGKILMGKGPVKKPAPVGKKPAPVGPKRPPMKPKTPVKPRTIEERKFIMDQLRKNPVRPAPKGGAGSIKKKPVMPKKAGK